MIPYDNRIWNSVTFELSRDRILLTRSVFSFLDLVSSLGGLFSAIGSLGSVLVNILQYRGTNMFIMGSMTHEEEVKFDK